MGLGDAARKVSSRLGCDEFHRSVSIQLETPFEDVWREWVKTVSKLPQGSLSSQAIEQLTISGLSRHGQPELENHLRVESTDAKSKFYFGVLISELIFFVRLKPLPTLLSPSSPSLKHIFFVKNS